ncbi:unnamed protein product, partial [Meganyctiphanes norvegica]
PTPAMDNHLIVLCLVFSTSSAAPQQQYVPPVPPGSPSFTTQQHYVPPVPPGSLQLQNQRDFKPVSVQINNAFPSNQPLPSTTVPVQQDVISLQNNQRQSSFGLQVPQNNQGSSPISLQDVTPLQNNQGQSSFGLQVPQNNQGSSPISLQDVTPLQNNQGQSSFGLQVTQNNQNLSPISLQEMTKIISEYDQNIQNGISNLNNVNNENGNGQATINNNSFNDDLNNPSRIAGNIGHADQVIDNQGLPIIPNGSLNGIIVNNVGLNGNIDESIVNDVAGEQHFSRRNNLFVNGNIGFDVNTQTTSSSQNTANIEKNHFISGHSENTQNNGQLISNDNLHTHQNVNNNTLSSAVENSELNNKFDINQSMQDIDDKQSSVTDYVILAKQKNKGDNQCRIGLVPNARGACVQPEVTRNLFVYAAPKMSHDSRNKSADVPRPKIEYNLVFVKTPKGNYNGEPIIVPPPQQKTLVYVLSKKNANGTQEIIEVPTGSKHNPEVYYINYEEGDNPTLPGGIELEEALSAAVQPGQTVNDFPSGPLLRDDISHGNIDSTANTGSITDEINLNGIDLHETSGDIIANTLTNISNNAESFNNYQNANNQNGHNSNVDIRIITGVGSGNEFINNGAGLDTAGESVPSTADTFDGSLTESLQVPVSAVNPGNGYNARSDPFATKGEGPNFGQILPAA